MYENRELQLCSPELQFTVLIFCSVCTVVLRRALAYPDRSHAVVGRARAFSGVFAHGRS